MPRSIKKLYFWQPEVGLSVQVKAKSKDGKAIKGKQISASSYCRALLNRDLAQKIRDVLTTPCFAPRKNWAGHVESVAVGREVTKSLVLAENDQFAKIGVSGRSLKRYSKRRSRSWGYYQTEWVPDKGRIPISRVKDFYYLADLLCGTFGVLLDPRETPRVPTLLKVSDIKSCPTSLSYIVGGPEILLSPAITALYLAQLRLAAFLAANGEAAAIAKVAPRAEVRKAVLGGDRKACVSLLRKAQKWVVRSENGLWAFPRGSTPRFRKLMKYLAGGGTAVSLFGQALDKNWGLSRGYSEFHGRGFRDFMKGSGDRKVAAAIENK
jgi:hypothetical protein